MKFSFVTLCLALAGCAYAADPCTDLCHSDGPQICTKGSWTEKGSCKFYVFLGDPANMNHCYHTSETASSCPSGSPVKPEHIPALIAKKNSKPKADTKAQPKQDSNSGNEPPARETQASGSQDGSKQSTRKRSGVSFEALVVGPASGKHESTVFLLHGKNGKPEHMIDLGRDSWMRSMPNTKFVSLRAPGGLWFNFLVSSPQEMAFRLLAGQEVADKESLHSSMEIFTAMIDAEASQLRGGHSKVFVIGYSQGGMLSVYTALMGGRRLGGVAIMNSAVPLMSLDGVSDEGAKTPILHIHAIQDTIVPIVMARRGHNTARNLGATEYELEERPGSHDPHVEVARRVTNWVISRL